MYKGQDITKEVYALILKVLIFNTRGFLYGEKYYFWSVFMKYTLSVFFVFSILSCGPDDTQESSSFCSSTVVEDYKKVADECDGFLTRERKRECGLSVDNFKLKYPKVHCKAGKGHLSHEEFWVNEESIEKLRLL